MYRQSINHIKLAIIPLDGTVFDLNRFRYNYYHHLCDHKKIPFGVQDFYPHLSSMYDMYKDLPLTNKLDAGPLNSKIERELSQYLNYKGIEPKEGFLELLEYLHQKEIPIAIISTHRTKDAAQYLKLAKIYHKVHFIIGSDAVSSPLPSTDILETTLNHFHVKNNEVLLISSFAALNEAASKMHFNIIYCEDLVEADTYEKETSYKIVHNLFEVLNTLLFDQYDEAEIYSPILGMSSDMTSEELTQVKDELKEKYHDDQQIVDLVNQTYAYHISQLNEQSIKDGSVLLNQTPMRKRFHFDDETQEISKSELFSLTDEEEIQEEMSNEVVEKKAEEIHISPLDKEEEIELTELLQQINFSSSQKDESQPILEVAKQSEQTEEIIENNEEEKSSPVFEVFLNIIYIFAISFLVLFAGIIVYITFIHQFEMDQGIFHTIHVVFQAYHSFVNMIFEGILDFLHTFISFIPSYQQYSQSNTMLSIDGVLLLNLFIFQTIIIAIIKGIVHMIKRSLDDESLPE